jgi:TPP-dependent pyruvate/acetoin dehydrogenase alpha subunit
MQGDGNDALEVHSMVVNALAAIRAGGGPRFLEFSTYRWREHCGPFYDNDLGYRAETEFLEWKEKEPIGRLATSMLAERAISADEIREMDAQVEHEVNEAFAFAENSPFPDASSASDDVYAERAKA